jgi:hypothetical protein
MVLLDGAVVFLGFLAGQLMVSGGGWLLFYEGTMSSMYAMMYSDEQQE